MRTGSLQSHLPSKKAGESSPSSQLVLVILQRPQTIAMRGWIKTSGQYAARTHSDAIRTTKGVSTCTRVKVSLV